MAGFIVFGKRAEAVWRYLPLRAQRVLKEGKEIDKRRGNHEVPPPLARSRRAGARIPPPAGGETPLCTGACALCVKRNTARAAQAQNPLTELGENTNSLLTTAIR